MGNLRNNEDFETGLLWFIV